MGHFHLLVTEFDYNYYLTTTNDLCYYDWDEETTKTIASGVKDFNSYGYYLTTTNDLCHYIGDTSTTIARGVKEFNNNGYYLTTTNDLCYYDWDEETSKTIANGITRCGFEWYELNGGDVYILYKIGLL